MDNKQKLQEGLTALGLTLTTAQQLLLLEYVALLKKWNGTYNLTGGGEVVSWAQVAKRVYELTGHDPADVTPISTAEYFAGKQVAPRPLVSTMDLSKIEAIGFKPSDSMQLLETYVQTLRS